MDEGRKRVLGIMAAILASRKLSQLDRVQMVPSTVRANCCFVLLLIARPKQHLVEPVSGLFRDLKRLKSRVTRAAFEFLYPA